jgi:glycosyltransferase involved in cell wall biosynthesis
MKLAFFTNSYLPYLSGVTLSVKTLKDELEKLGHTVYIIGPSYPGHKETDPHVLSLPSFLAPYPGYRLVWPYSYKIFKFLRQEKIDLIHAHQPFGVGLTSLVLARRLKVPLVYSFHTLFTRYLHNIPFLPQYFSHRVVTAYLRWFCGQTDTIVVPSTMVRRVLSVWGVKKPVAVIPTGLKLERIKAHRHSGQQSIEIRRQLGLPPTAKLLLYSGRIAPEKNIPFLLQAFDAIRQQEPETWLVLVGGGPKMKEYQQIAGKQVVFTGQCQPEKLLDYYFAADIFVYSSVTETQGLVLTEAKACGLPVVAVFGGGLADVINNGQDGYLVPQKLESFVSHVLRLLGDPELRRQMGHQGQLDAFERFSSIAVAKEMENTYNSLIQKRGN